MADEEPQISQQISEPLTAKVSPSHLLIDKILFIVNVVHQTDSRTACIRRRESITIFL